jgi:hypothetical protein
VVIGYAFTIGTGAFLLFLVQPLIAKFILPWFGGSPGVWTVCMLFFQSILLAGYVYAHCLSRFLATRTQAMVHMSMLAAAVLSLRLTSLEQSKPEPGDDPTFAILLLLSSTIGFAYFVLSATGPLLQRWYSDVTNGASPYRLFALSNLGSLLALLGYPVLFEPWISRNAQTSLWSGSMVVFALACGSCAWLLLRWSQGEGAQLAAGMTGLLKGTERSVMRPASSLQLFFGASSGWRSRAPHPSRSSPLRTKYVSRSR